MSAEPKVGELIYGCHCSGTHCGKVSKVLEHVTKGGFNHYIVEEDWNSRRIRAKREGNGLLYEVEIVPGGMDG